jgi:hypothetical protein
LNRQIKDTHFLRERLQFGKFTEVIFEMISTDWTAGRETPDEITHYVKPHLFVLAKELKDQKRAIYRVKDDLYVVPSAQYSDLTKRECKEAWKNISSSDFSTFEDYVTLRFKVCVELTHFSSSINCRCTRLRKSMVTFSVRVRLDLRKLHVNIQS